MGGGLEVLGGRGGAQFADPWSELLSPSFTSQSAFTLPQPVFLHHHPVDTTVTHH